MTIESATYISDLNASYPGASDQKSEGDDHIRLLKSAVKATFPNVAGAVTPTHTQLNYVTGVTSAIQTQLDSKVGSGTIAGLAPIASPALTGSASITKAGTAYNEALRLESSASVSGQFSPAITFSASNVNAAIYSQRLSSAGGRLILATQATGGGNPIQRVAVNEDGSVTFSGVVSAPGFTGPLSGNISQFTNDAGYITATGAAAAGSLTGTALASNVVSSSLTSVGNLSALTVTSPIVGSVTGSAGSVAWTSVTGKPTVFSTVSTVTNFTGSDVGTGSYITDVSISAVGSAITLTVSRTYHTGGGGGGP